MKRQSLETEYVILVDESDAELGLMPKMEAHEKGLLHRAFSVFIFNTGGEMLLQQRAGEKYHSPGLWSNTCCSHPREGEKTIGAAARRLREEMGMECSLVKGFDFVYKAEFGNGLKEHEYDHVFFGTSDVVPEINEAEVQAWKYMDVDLLAEDLKLHPEAYTEWLKIAFERSTTLYRSYEAKKQDKTEPHSL
jgi:isopentenyl-diphosphate Delta-isomerase